MNARTCRTDWKKDILTCHALVSSNTTYSTLEHDMHSALNRVLRDITEGNISLVVKASQINLVLILL